MCKTRTNRRVPHFFNKFCKICFDQLRDNKDALAYLKKRNINIKTIKEFQLGYFDPNIRAYLGKINAQDLRKNNVFFDAQYSPFEHYNLVIPIRDPLGNSVAIGCRTMLGEAERKELGIPKYRNTEFNKSSYLFGLDLAKNAIRENNNVFVVEGYLDVISAHQAGIKNVVGSLGTNISERQMSVLSRYTDNIGILFDNDKAGKISASRVLQKRSRDDVSLSSFSIVGHYKDLDELICEKKNVPDIFDYLVKIG